MSRLLFAGQSVLDCVFDVERLPPPGGKGVARHASMQPGGLAANAARAAAAARTGAEMSIVLLSAVGDDLAGRYVVESLGRESIDCSHVAVVAGARTSLSAIVVEAGGERQVVNDHGSALALASLPAASMVDGCTGLLVDTRWPEAAAPLLRRARECAIPSVLDAEAGAPRDLQRLVPLADWVVFSSAGLRAWAGRIDDVEACEARSLLDRAAEAAPRAELVTTLGARGALWRRASGDWEELPAFEVDVVDSNGAGDAMHGALLVALAEHRDARAAIRFAMAAGALACTRRNGFAARAEIDALLVRG